MEIYKRDEQVAKGDDTCVIREAVTGNGAINLAEITLDGRYPKESGEFAINTGVASLIRVVKGRGAVEFPDGDCEIAAGDEVHIAQNEPYAWRGKMTFLYVATPAWTPEQARQVKI